MIDQWTIGGAGMKKSAHGSARRQEGTWGADACREERENEKAARQVQEAGFPLEKVDV